MQHLSPTAQSIVAHLRAGLAALDDLKSQPERDLIYQVIASHVRSAAPMAFTGAADLVEPQQEAVVHLDDGQRVELRMIDGRLNLYAAESHERDTNVRISEGQREQLRLALGAVR